MFEKPTYINSICKPSNVTTGHDELFVASKYKTTCTSQLSELVTLTNTVIVSTSAGPAQPLPSSTTSTHGLTVMAAGPTSHPSGSGFVSLSAFAHIPKTNHVNTRMYFIQIH